MTKDFENLMSDDKKSEEKKPKDEAPVVDEQRALDHTGYPSQPPYGGAPQAQYGAPPPGQYGAPPQPPYGGAPQDHQYSA
ncbi:hypothetical protein V498_09251, partial [Pseudogymnoascus sp. VKM F-4517 (FW-2822)]